ncbi:MAG: RagB/SusD family nutrient uptake outer membrane protein [Cytophagales bacterium]|nr:RagB/SusD family nutrient uptake outer membrane protein [Cytophagales bacterium]
MAGCTENFVDIQPPTQVTVDNFFRNETEARQGINGLYNTLRGRYGNYWLFTEVPSDNSTFAPESQAATGEFDLLGWGAQTNALSGAWNGHYQTIANANIALARIPNVQMDQTLRSRLLGEARFIRALMYFNLVRFFGDVPLVTQEQIDPAVSRTFLRRPAAEVYAQIEADLTEAIGALPQRYTVQNDIGRATSGAARTLLAKVHMQQREYAQALPLLRDVVANETAYGYQLLGNYANVFITDNNAEIVFSVQYEPDNQGSGSDFPAAFLPQIMQAPNSAPRLYTPPIGLGGNNLPTRDILLAFEPNDIRRPVSVDSLTNVPGVLFTRKFVVPAAAFTINGNSDVDWPVIRYADVLLMYAECLNETGATADAIAQVNRVRTRATLPVLVATLSQTDARAAILKERRVELCFEGHRWHDLIRAGVMVETLQAFATRYNVRGLTPTANQAVYAIPQRERSINPEITQNPGY